MLKCAQTATVNVLDMCLQAWGMVLQEPRERREGDAGSYLERTDQDVEVVWVSSIESASYEVRHAMSSTSVKMLDTSVLRLRYI